MSDYTLKQFLPVLQNAGLLGFDTGGQGTSSSPVYIKFVDTDGTAKYAFIDTNGYLRVHTSIPTANTDGDIVGASVEARTASADGTGTGQISVDTAFVTVTSAGANNIITLPAPVVGKVIYLRNAGTGYELRTSAPATIAINGGAGDNAESAIGANVLVRVVCDTATTWVGTNFATNGTVAATQVAG